MMKWRDVECVTCKAQYTIRCEARTKFKCFSCRTQPSREVAAKYIIQGEPIR